MIPVDDQRISMLHVIRLFLRWFCRILIPRHMARRVRRGRAQASIVLMMFARAVHGKCGVYFGNIHAALMNVAPKL